MPEPEPTTLRYYAWTSADRPQEQPAEIMRVFTGPGVQREEIMHRDGRWQATDYFARARQQADGATDERLVAIPAEQAAVVLNRWRATGVIPLVEGVLLPPLPATDEPAPAPGSGPVDAAAAQAIADEWVNGSGFSDVPIRAGIYEFDLGYVVFPVLTRPQDQSGRGAGLGDGRGVIDRATGELTLWPSFPFGRVAEMYRQKKARESGADTGA